MLLTIVFALILGLGVWYALEDYTLRHSPNPEYTFTPIFPHKGFRRKN